MKESNISSLERFVDGVGLGISLLMIVVGIGFLALNEIGRGLRDIAMGLGFYFVLHLFWSSRRE